MRPNLFRFATSELTQDAVLCWLLAWADQGAAQHDRLLHGVGVDFLRSLFAAAGTAVPDGPLAVTLGRQVHKADVVALVGDRHVLVVEDKTGTQEHSDQLERYQAAIQQQWPGRQLVLVYLKTGDQASYQAVRDKGWAAFTRGQLLDVLRPARAAVTSDVLVDFLDHMESIEVAVQSYRATPPSAWSRSAWAGFYQALSSALGQGAWDYVPNPTGGFMGFWWAFHPVDGAKLYLQLEEERLCVKVQVTDPTHRRALREAWSLRFLRDWGGLPFRRPKKFGSGQYMTIAVLDGPYLMTSADGLVDLAGTVKGLTVATHQLREMVGRKR